MNVELINNCCVVTREKDDPKFSGTLNAAGESRLLYHIKIELNAQGYDLIKKRMYKDGHLVDDMQQYLRTRKPSGDPDKDIYIYNPNWNVEGAEMPYNEHGEVILSVEKNVFNKYKE